MQTHNYGVSGAPDDLRKLSTEDLQKRLGDLRGVLPKAAAALKKELARRERPRK